MLPAPRLPGDRVGEIPLRLPKLGNQPGHHRSGVAARARRRRRVTQAHAVGVIKRTPDLCIWQARAQQAELAPLGILPGPARPARRPAGRALVPAAKAVSWSRAAAWQALTTRVPAPAVTWLSWRWRGHRAAALGGTAPSSHLR